ncbi:class I SAM-dependent methyltransferase, partial [candidate division WOR-3 bacterium]|nr:class I SAM-dependent methyltransferase [candidate division WOR-3 bacterium]
TAFSPLNQAVTVDYNRPEIVDAYSLYYLRRNALIPRIAIRDMTLNQRLQSFPEELRVLDLGSGTGAVTLGLLDMFLHPPFNTISIHVDAFDGSIACLNRLKQHKEASGLSSFSVNPVALDIRNVALLDTLLNDYGSYDLIFAANIFNELEHTESCEILRCLSKHLADNAVIVIANAQRDFIKELHPLLVTEAHNNGLSVYYPCPTHDTSAHDCWF